MTPMTYLSLYLITLKKILAPLEVHWCTRSLLVYVQIWFESYFLILKHY